MPRLSVLFVVTCIVCLSHVGVFGQLGQPGQPPGNPGGDPDVPISGIEWLLIGGGALGLRKLISLRKRKSNS